MRLVVGTLFFLIPYNLLMYGVNDVFDYASDLANPRKGGIEGGLVDPSRARAVAPAHPRGVRRHDRAVRRVAARARVAARRASCCCSCCSTSSRTPRRGCGSRSGPSWTRSPPSMHFVGPLLYALVLAGADLAARTTWPVLVAFLLWGMASHAFGAVQDVRADRAGGLASVATVLGARPDRARRHRAPTRWPRSCCSCCRGPGCSPRCCRCRTRVSTWRFRGVTDEDCERANAGWRTFLWLNLVTGFLVTMLLIAVALG